MKVRRLIHEIHRRSLWQVLLIYLSAGFAAIQLVELVSRQLALPPWIVGLALVLLIVGLPIVLATAFVQEGGPLSGPAVPGPEAGRPRLRILPGSRGDPKDPVSSAPSVGGPATSVDPPAGRRPAHHLLTWRNALGGGVLAFATWGLVAAVWVAAGKMGSSAPEPVRKIAVLPFADLTGDSTQAYFAEGMAEGLRTELAQIHGLVVLSRAAVMRYRDSQPAARQIARELNVDAVLAGSVTRGAENVRISVQLIDGRTDAHLWAQNYLRGLGDALGLQSQVAREVATAIEIRLTPEEEARLTDVPSVDPTAAEAYLQALRLLQVYIRGHQGLPTLERAIDLYRKAVELEPTWARARARLAQAYHIRGSRLSPPDSASYERARAEALEAIRLDDASPAGHAALGWVLTYWDRDWAGGEREYRRALELSPHDAANAGWGFHLFAAGRYDEAAGAFREALVRNPWAAQGQMGLISSLACAGRYEAALDAININLERYPDWWTLHMWRADIFFRQARGVEAIEEMREAVRLAGSDDTDFLVPLAYMYASLGRTVDARELLRELEARKAWMPAVYAALGQTDSAVAQLRRAYDDRRHEILWIRCFSQAAFADLTEIEGLRRHPDFQELLRKIDFPAS